MPVDTEKFAKHLRAATGESQISKGTCGIAMREGLQAAGAKGPFPGTGKEYGPTLLRLGFHEITVDNPDTFNFLRGDVMVMQPHKGGKQAGHVAGYDGSRWVSDFVQHDFWAGPKYRTERSKYVVYRY
ncbi:MAG: hypothetical protein H7335_17380 [Massilia sp.]|nr:hypothetical protein [Massilia sp.]